MDIKTSKSVRDILEKVTKSGYKIYIVGGAVRDLLMNREVGDWDFTTDAKPEELLKIFPEGFYDNKFGTVGIAIGNQIYEITTMRKEGNYQDHRHPIEVSWTNKIEEDLARRDFTINALALSSAGSVIDPHQGQEDLKNKITRAVGDPKKRFQEDALRLIRAVRITTQLEFKIDLNTLKAIKENANLIKEVANERIRNELFKLLSSNYPDQGISLLRESGILQIILPELEKTFGLKQEGSKHDRIYDIGEHSLLSLKHTPSKDPLVKLAALLHDVGKTDTVQIQPDGNVTFYNHDLVG